MKAVGMLLIACGAVLFVVAVGYMNGMAPIIETPWSSHSPWNWWDAIPAVLLYLFGILYAALARTPRR